MLICRVRPVAHQCFGDYLSDLGMLNGFTDVVGFRKFLTQSANENGNILAIFPGMVKIIVGLFIELGIFKTESSESVCFRCLRGSPRNWVWKEMELKYLKVRCPFYEKGYRDNSKGNEVKGSFCGVIKCSPKMLGLNLNPKQAGLYYADFYSKYERDTKLVHYMYPHYGAFRSE